MCRVDMEGGQISDVTETPFTLHESVFPLGFFSAAVVKGWERGSVRGRFKTHLGRRNTMFLFLS